MLHYPIADCDWHPYLIATVLRMHLMRSWFGLRDPALGEALSADTAVCAPATPPSRSRDHDPELPPLLETPNLPTGSA